MTPHSPDDWMPDCPCDPPCILQRLASMSRGELLDYAIEVGAELELYRADEDDRIERHRKSPWRRLWRSFQRAVYEPVWPR